MHDFLLDDTQRALRDEARDLVRWVPAPPEDWRDVEHDAPHADAEGEKVYG